MKIKNIFDEIYYDELGALTNTIGRGSAALGKINGVESWNRSDEYDIDFSPQFFERYAENGLPSSLNSLEYSFSFQENEPKKGTMVMAMQKKLDNDLFVYVNYIYNVQKRELVERIGIENNQELIATDKNDVEKYLEKNNTSLSEINKFGEDILKNKLLKDWCSVYSSRFSPDNLGKVNVTTN